LLLLSGIGPKTEIEKHGIETKHHLPGVGKNLQDHLQFVNCFNSKTSNTFLWFQLTAPSQIPKWRKDSKLTPDLSNSPIQVGGFTKIFPDDKVES
jgi:choline dehydrogenase-like flavoprotein